MLYIEIYSFDFLQDKRVGNPRLIAVTVKGDTDFPNKKEEFPLTCHNEHDWILREDIASCMITTNNFKRFVFPF
jgi:hypothetical protein